MVDLLKKLMISLKDSLDVQDKYEELTVQLIQENKFLIDTISEHNLGKITSERRSLLLQVEKAEISAKAIKNEADNIKDEYSDKLDKITMLIKDVKSKQSEIDKYIALEAKKRVSKKEKSLDLKYKERRDKLESEYKIREEIIIQKSKSFKQMLYVSILCMITSVVSSLLENKLLLILIPIIVIISIIMIIKLNERT